MDVAAADWSFDAGSSPDARAEPNAAPDAGATDDAGAGACDETPPPAFAALLDETNAERGLYGSPALCWSTELAQHSGGLIEAGPFVDEMVSIDALRCTAHEFRNVDVGVPGPVDIGLNVVGPKESSPLRSSAFQPVDDSASDLRVSRGEDRQLASPDDHAV